MSIGVVRKNGSADERARIDAEKISRVAAFIVSAYGDNAIEHARRLEAESVVPDLAKCVRIEVERLVQASASAGGMHLASAGISESTS